MFLIVASDETVPLFEERDPGVRFSGSADILQYFQAQLILLQTYTSQGTNI